MNGEPAVRHTGDTWPPLSLGAGGVVKLAAVIYSRTRALREFQLLLSFNICAHIAFLLRFTGPHAPAAHSTTAAANARDAHVLVPGRGQYPDVKCLAVRRTPITPHTLRVRRNVRFPGKFALSPEQPAAASSARISGRQAGSVSGGLPIRLGPLRYGVRYPDVGGRVGGTMRPHWTSCSEWSRSKKRCTG